MTDVEAGSVSRPPSADPHVLQPGHSPTPFTADEIRRGCPPGRTIRLLVESAAGEPHVRLSRFLEGDEEGADIEAMRLTTDGEPMGPPEKRRTTWLELQAHASFPSGQTTVEPEVIDIPIGRLACLRYTVDDGSSVHTFWFATTLPGMPVRFTTQEAGVVTTTVTMIGDDRE